MIIDSHCHLNYLKLDDINLEKVINNAKTAGIEKIVSIAVAWDEIADIEQITENFDNVYHSVGVHPSELDSYQPSVDDIIARSQHKKCVAIGETGLDYYYNGSDTREAQINKFVNHMQAANEVNKPVIIHTRSAKQDTLDILKSENVEKCGGILHCFMEDYDMAKKTLDMCMYISFSGILTFKNAKDIQETAKKLPLDRILIETDAPYLTPVPLRGKPNYPEYVKYVAQFLADLKGISYNEVAKQTYQNTCEVFGF
ncbi:TatD family hydrolase [Francisella orientalis]|uniref:Deoxyribonuclease Tat-D type n=1 Tax=Francisella orientalis TaxID=299583 RepID=A0AAP7C5G8_9GAMM|nr:TatD family hydrolase [Francisella orientalis]AFJ43324.1 TatD family hydrolase [Francisella orientalis str. Toba 04]AHB98750.1 TatD family hydrolase [Francisella orientalis LADL 07-285A]AKN86010.1 Deoxyribonuclease Tat-D type [Francisella orientalis FNO12]AKN87548.1 Deoxyribonuclease Tat-D type [Francisella orientalis FNO24]AKN89086.1 Deoxyribonuclease Tat-D type [Francisella orientalis]